MSTTYPMVFTWKCPDCRGQGEVVLMFPLHPDSIVEQVMAEHAKLEAKRHCACPAHYLAIKPKPLEL